jgi:hypothetical protein
MPAMVPFSGRASFGCLLLVLGTTPGCQGVQPQRITEDRMDYGQVVAESWKRQALLNVVRLRYSDAPVFLDVTSIINSNTTGGRVAGGFEVYRVSDSSFLNAGGEGSWSHTPTVTYQPVMGDRFYRSLVQPVPPAAVFQMLQGGWPVELVLPTVVASIQGLRNASGGVAEDPAFAELTEQLATIQRARGLSIRVEPRKDGSAVVLVLGEDHADAALAAAQRRVRELLRLAPDARQLEIVYSMHPAGPAEVAVLTRSTLEIILQLGFGIDLPAGHVSEGRASAGRWRAGDERARPLARIHSGAQPPSDAYAAAPYKGTWYWIDDTDTRSKRVFTFLMLLFSLAETGQTAIAPTLTVPSR